MGVTVGDYNGDGLLDIFKTHFADDLPILYKNSGRAFFEDSSREAGFDHTRYVQWGTGLADFDNDGWPDILTVTGNVYPEVEKYFKEYSHRSIRLVYRNLGNGRFKDVTAQCGPGVLTPHSSRGCAFGDFDNDGDIDVLVMNMNEPPSLLRNDVSGGRHWLKVLLVGVKTNRSAIGSRVVAHYGGRRQAPELTAQSSFYSANHCRLHFGLGSETAADLTIRWTNVAIETIRNVAADQLVTIREGAGITGKQKFR